MYLYLFTSTGWKFICTVCSTATTTSSTAAKLVLNGQNVYSIIHSESVM